MLLVNVAHAAGSAAYTGPIRRSGRRLSDIIVRLAQALQRNFASPSDILARYATCLTFLEISGYTIYMSQRRRLSYLLGLNITMITALVIVGLKSHSLGVLAAGGDFIADSFAISLGLLAVHLRDNHGNERAPTYVALINGLLLISVTVFVAFQSIERLLTHNLEVQGLPVLVVSSISAVVMVVGVLILGQGAGNEDLHMRSVLLDTISDGLAATGVAIVGAIIYFSKGLYWLDSAAALLVSLVIGYGAIMLLRDVYVALKSHTPISVT